jgi:hypothetical protein
MYIQALYNNIEIIKDVFDWPKRKGFLGNFQEIPIVLGA